MDASVTRFPMSLQDGPKPSGAGVPQPEKGIPAAAGEGPSIR